jgi:hypothetical protein
MKTHWKKNNDSRYISGEDLKFGESLGKGLRPEMVVTIAAFKDAESFDQKEQEKIIKTGLDLLEYPSGKPLHKPVLLNNKNGEFFQKEFGSEFLEDWVGKPVIMFAMVDKRHGYVVRFKKFFQQQQVSDVQAMIELAKCTNLAELKSTWDNMSQVEKNLPTVMAKKETLKATLK